MNAAMAVFRRELRGYFTSPVAYVFLVVFLALSSFSAFRGELFEARDANLRVFFAALPGLFVLFAPAIAMRMWAEERRSGTIEFLLTLPITVPQAVLGKFLAGWIFFVIALALTTPLVATVCYLGDPDWGPIVSGYFGAALMAGGYLAIGSFCSILTKNQTIALILGMVVCAFFWFAGTPSMANTMQQLPLVGGTLARVAESLSFLTHYDVMQRGVIEFRNVFFLLVITAGFLASSCVMLNDRKAA